MITPQNINWFRKLGNRFLKWLRELFKGDGTTAATKESSQEREIRENREELDRAINVFSGQTSLNVNEDKLSDAINSYQCHEEKTFEKQGYDDGVKGIRDAAISTPARARASFVVEHTNAILEGKIAGLRIASEAEASKIEAIDARMTTESIFNKTILKISREKPGLFGRWALRLYIIAGFSLMIADFPVSMAISHHFIDPPADLADTFRAKLLCPEILMFSLGITFLGLFFKVFFDEFIDKGIIPDNLDTGKDDDTPYARFKMAGRISVKLAILLGLIILLYNIGQIRSFLDTTDGIDPKNIRMTPQMKGFKLWSFVGATILLPLISGVCLSKGFSILSNIRNFSKSNAALQKLQKEKDGLHAKKIRVDTVGNMLGSLQTQWNKESKIDALAQLLTKSYNQGYKRGFKTKYGENIYRTAHAVYVDHLNSNY
ncbi:hypothetical protein F0L74_27090 [Chitinophaga agrisoli]|uniref:Uncharacterized protein n=1 Tax=Chitinophaga agrisoli TaxID=2607653 RepID=A0A5B2VLS3_9BACT|nr:hypothetical protein [Chitinophaga agrisoli]KAA2239855.1 hypothetical protein F0L74_27090 [Chitinophaga agrisoli]